MVLPVFENHKIAVYQLLGGLLGRRPGHQQRFAKASADRPVWRVKPAPIIRCFAELLEHSGILKCPGGKIAAAAERDRSDNWTIASEIVNTHVRDNCLRCRRPAECGHGGKRLGRGRSPRAGKGNRRCNRAEEARLGWRRPTVVGAVAVDLAQVTEKSLGRKHGPSDGRADTRSTRI
jgi:hypothetical protein